MMSKRGPEQTVMNSLIDETDATERTHAVEALQRSADHLRLVIDTVPGFVWSARPDGSIEFLNQRGLDYTGFSLEQIRGWNWKDTNILHPDDAQGLTETWSAIVASGQPGEIQARMRRFDGEYRWFLFGVAPLRDESGGLIVWWGIDLDIDERKRAETLLAGENRLLEMAARGCSLTEILAGLCRLIEELSSGALCGILLVDPARNRVKHGAAPSLPQSYNEAIHGSPVNPSAGPCGMAACLKVQVIAADIASDARWEAEWRTLALSHGLRACWSTPIQSSDGSVLGTFAIYWRESRSPTEQHQRIIEQTTHLAAVAIERERTQAALQSSEERFRLIVDSIPGFVSTMNAVGEVEIVNLRTLDYLGMTREEIRDWPRVLHDDDRALVLDRWSRSIQTGEPYDIQHRIRRADGVYRWFHVRGLAFFFQAEDGI